MKEIIKVGYLLSYDYQYIFTSIELIYDFVDKIVICYDKDGKTWAGNNIKIPNEVFEKIKSIDYKNKIFLYSDSFYIEGLPPIELETRQRNMLAKQMGEGGWHIQLDCDEYPINFDKLSIFLRKYQYLLKNPSKTPVNFLVNWVTLFKQNEYAFFVVTPYTEKCCLITNVPDYLLARRPKNDFFIPLDFNLIHQSWARDREEIIQKITNWGHKDDFDTQNFFKKWESLNLDNYTKYKNFHPLSPDEWKSIKFIKAININEFIEVFQKENTQKNIKMNLKWTKKLKLYLRCWL